MEHLQPSFRLHFLEIVDDSLAVHATASVRSDHQLARAESKQSFEGADEGNILRNQHAERRDAWSGWGLVDVTVSICLLAG